LKGFAPTPAIVAVTKPILVKQVPESGERVSHIAEQTLRDAIDRPPTLGISTDENLMHRYSGEALMRRATV
jgi:hypothetical protein